MRIIWLFILLISKVVSGQKVNVQGSDKFKTTHPYFMYELAELDTFFNSNVTIHPTFDNIGINAKTKFKFEVSDSGKVSNISLIEYDLSYQSGLIFNKDSAFIDSAKSAKRLYLNEISRILQMTNGMWIIKAKEVDYGANWDKNYSSSVYMSKIFYSIGDSKNKALKERMDWGRSTTWISSISFVRDVSEMNIKRKKTLYDFGVTKLNQKKYNLAKAYFIESLRYFPNEIDAWYNLGLTNFYLRDNKSACYCWNEAQAYGDKEVSKLIKKYCK